MFIPTYSMQYICMAIAAFIDRRHQPAWPRWVAVTGAGGVLAVFFKTGPFSWNGIIGFWIPTAVFAAGMFMNAWLLHRRLRYESTPGAV
jgi:hypothetical protein